MTVRQYLYFVFALFHLPGSFLTNASSCGSHRMLNEASILAINPAAQIFASTRILLLCDVSEDVCKAATDFLQSGGAEVLRKVKAHTISFVVVTQFPP
jgi:hypothetical protein